MISLGFKTVVGGSRTFYLGLGEIIDHFSMYIILQYSSEANLGTNPGATLSANLGDDLGANLGTDLGANLCTDLGAAVCRR